jgi:hypothetical protein
LKTKDLNSWKRFGVALSELKKLYAGSMIDAVRVFFCVQDNIFLAVRCMM